MSEQNYKILRVLSQDHGMPWSEKLPALVPTLLHNYSALTARRFGLLRSKTITRWNDDHKKKDHTDRSGWPRTVI